MNTAGYECRRGVLKTGVPPSDSRVMIPRAAVALVLFAAMAAGACATGRTASARPEPFPRSGARELPAREPNPIPALPDNVDGMTPASVTPLTAAVLETALALRGTPYTFGGTSPDSGFDCRGFVRYVFLQHAVDLPRTVMQQFLIGADVGDDPIAAGDLIFFSTVAPGASHVGIALDAGSFVHAPGSGSVVRIERLSAPYWRSRMIGVRRLLALTITG